MVSAGGALIRNEESQGDLLRRLLYTDLLEQQEQAGEKGETFIRYMPNGRLPEIRRKVEVVAVPLEEIHARRMEEMERELYQKVYAEAQQAGLEIGEQKMRQEINRVLPQLESLLRSLDGLPERIFAASERFLVETCLMLTRELLAHELSVHPEEITHRIRRILKNAAGRREIVLRIAPEIYEIIKECNQFPGVRLEADAGVKPGSVVMESDFGGLEDLIEEQLQAVEMQIRKFLQQRLSAGPHADLADGAATRAIRSLEAERPPLAVQGLAAMAAAARAAALAVPDEAPMDDVNEHSGLESDLEEGLESVALEPEEGTEAAGLEDEWEKELASAGLKPGMDEDLAPSGPEMDREGELEVSGLDEGELATELEEPGEDYGLDPEFAGLIEALEAQREKNGGQS
ncbi:MAG: hypothetical protein HQL76_16825 [Magnetococcales bacterium]|nr:hypothetical protein [Magnetococcales bacterium]